MYSLCPQHCLSSIYGALGTNIVVKSSETFSNISLLIGPRDFREKLSRTFLEQNVVKGRQIVAKNLAKIFHALSLEWGLDE